MKRISLFSFLLLGNFSFAQNSAQTPNEEATKKFENRLNELMFGKLSDELSLKPAEESKLKKLFKKYQDLRQERHVKREASLRRMEKWYKASDHPATCDGCLNAYRSSVLSISDIDSKEYEELKKLLGEARLIKFYVLRSQMTNDVKAALMQSSSASSAKKK